MLPSEIVDVLRHRDGVIADQNEDVSVLFADIVGFTPMSERMPAELDTMLNRGDVLVHDAGLEKIKTIGDCYMVASGVPRPRADHARALARWSPA